ncbi:MAG: response regulator [Candidatus Omnitrophota bacterium]|nr:response regulator [Candidatus Omnitrophota bacterium]
MDGKKIRVLVVDGEKIIRDFLVRFFAFEGVEASTAQDGPAAIEMAHRENFDIIFIDIRMPKVDGYGVFKELKKIIPEAKCVMMTGYAVDDVLTLAHEAGAAAVLKKPFEIEHIRNLIESVRKAA